MLRQLVSLLRAAGALVTLAALLLGLPGVLALGTIAVGRQAPPGPQGGLWQMLTSPDNGNLFLWALVVVGWAAWAAFALSVVVEIPAQLRGRVPRRLPALGWSQRLAGGLVGAVLAVLPSAAGALAATPAAVPAAVAPRAVAAAPQAAHAGAAGTAGVMGAAAAATAAESGAVAGHSLPVYTVRDTKPAESLWSIAERELGSGTRWREIARLNAGRVMDAEGRVFDADRPIHPGWKLLLPHDAAGAGGAAGGATSGPTTRRPALPRGGKHVTVEPGDTLSAIAERELGAADLWPELYAANEGVPGPHGTRLTDPDVIQPGMVLTIPGTRPKGGSGGHGSGSGHGAHPGQGAGSGSGSAPGPGQGSGAGHGSTGSGAGSGPGAGSGAGSGSSSSGASAPAPTPTPTSTPKSTPTPSTTAGGGSAFGPTGGDSGATPSGSASASDPGTSSGTGTGAPSAAAAVPEAGGRTGFTASSAEQLAGLGSAVLLAVLGGALARRRARRRAAGRPLTRRHALPARPQSDAAAHSGQPPVPSSAPQFVLPEPELQPEQSAENGLDLLDRALRSMARNVIRDGLRLPPLTLARITATGTVELYLATPAPPIPPFRAAHASTVWWCTEEEFGLLGAEAVRGIVAPYPALVSVGTSDDGATVLLDLEAVRLLHVSGPPEDVRAVLRTLALELTLTPLADRVGVHVVGVAEDLAVLAEDRLTVHPDLEHALVALRERDRDVRAELLAVGAATPRDARARGVGGDIWAPDVVLCAEYPSGDLPSALGRLLDARPRGSVAVVTAAPPPGAGPVARWTLPSRGVGALPGLDLTVRLQALDDGGYAAWLDALATEAGTELAQVEHLEPVAPPWPAPAGEPAAPGPWPDVPAPRSSERAGSASGSGASARGPWLVDSGAPGIRAEAGSPAPRAGEVAPGRGFGPDAGGPAPGAGEVAPGRGFGPEAESAVPEAGGSATGGGGVGRDAGPGLGAEGSALPADAPPPWLEGPAPRDGGASASGAEDGAPGPVGHGAAPSTGSTGGDPSVGNQPPVEWGIVGAVPPPPGPEPSPGSPEPPPSAPLPGAVGPRGHAGRLLPRPGDAPADGGSAAARMGAGRHAAHPGGGSAGAPAESWILQLLAAPRTASEAEGQPRVLVLGPVEVVDAPVAEAEWGAYVRAAVQDEATVSSDWQEFQALYARGIAERGAAGDTALARALALVRGAPFAEVTGPDYAWAEPFRTAIAQQIVDAAHELTLRRLRMGDHRGAEAAAARGLVVAPQAQLLLRDLLCVHADERATAALQRTAARLERLAAQGGARLEAESTALLSELRGGEPAWS